MDEPIQRFHEWFTSNGGYINASCHLEQDDNGISVRADTDIPRGEVAAKCPFSLTLSNLNLHAHVEDAEGGADDPVRYISETALEPLVQSNLPFETVSRFVLMEQRILAARSFWAPYMDVLPKEDRLNTPVYYDDEAMRFLKDTELDGAVRMRLRAWKEEWERALSVLEEKGRNVDGFTWFVAPV
jgi:hypothetical protein